jgi:hypothetical protein
MEAVQMSRAEEIQEWEARMAKDARTADEHEDMAAETQREREVTPMTRYEAMELIADYEADPSGVSTCDNLCTVLDGLPEQPPEGEYTPDEVRQMVREQL